jgi:predicted nucleotidyltransferase
MARDLARVDHDLLRAFRDAVRAKIARDLAGEEVAAVARLQRVRHALGPALAQVRSRGLCRGAWLFGSYAGRAPGERSDVDLLVEDCSDPFLVAAIVGRATDTDVHVVTIEEAPDSLRSRAIAEGERL